MIILNAGNPLVPLSAEAVWSTEHIVGAIDGALTCEGHKSLVVGSHGSDVQGTLVPVPLLVGPFSGAASVRAQRTARRTTGRVVRDREVDVVHLHDVYTLAELPDAYCTVFVTLHQPLHYYGRDLFERPYSGLQLICVSESQWRERPNRNLPMDVIPNGVDLRAFTPVAAKDDYVAIVGRICEDKGTELALRAARHARMPVRLAGQVLPNEQHEDYFDTSIVPLLSPDRQFIGPVGGQRKQELLARARAVIVTPQVDEASSLIVMEALACGTPVIATRRGALPELVEDGVTGWLADDVETIARAIMRISEISPLACRAAAEERFDVRQMTRAYLARYARARDGRPGGRNGPRAQSAARMAV